MRLKLKDTEFGKPRQLSTVHRLRQMDGLLDDEDKLDDGTLGLRVSLSSI